MQYNYYGLILKFLILLRMYIFFSIILKKTKNQNRKYMNTIFHIIFPAHILFMPKINKYYK